MANIKSTRETALQQDPVPLDHLRVVLCSVVFCCVVLKSIMSCFRYGVENGTKCLFYFHNWAERYLLTK